MGGRGWNAIVVEQNKPRKVMAAADTAVAVMISVQNGVAPTVRMALKYFYSLRRVMFLCM